MKMLDNDNDADFWAIMERIVAGKLDEHDQTKRSTGNRVQQADLVCDHASDDPHVADHP